MDFGHLPSPCLFFSVPTISALNPYSLTTILTCFFFLFSVVRKPAFETFRRCLITVYGDWISKMPPLYDPFLYIPFTEWRQLIPSHTYDSITSRWKKVYTITYQLLSLLRNFQYPCQWGFNYYLDMLVIALKLSKCLCLKMLHIEVIYCCFP